MAILSMNKNRRAREIGIKYISCSRAYVIIYRIYSTRLTKITKFVR